jgi:hypothetical protein
VHNKIEFQHELNSHQIGKKYESIWLNLKPSPFLFLIKMVFPFQENIYFLKKCTIIFVALHSQEKTADELKFTIKSIQTGIIHAKYTKILGEELFPFSVEFSERKER